jgi:hypothetical protein
MLMVCVENKNKDGNMEKTTMKMAMLVMLVVCYVRLWRGC